jgi:hypothetical protein
VACLGTHAVECTEVPRADDKKSRSALLENSAVSGMVDLSTRLKELLVYRAYVRSRRTKVRDVG